MALPDYRDYADHLFDGSDCDLPLPFLPPDPPPSPAELALAELRLEAALRAFAAVQAECRCLDDLQAAAPLPQAVLDHWQIERHSAAARRVRAAAAAWARARGEQS